MSLHFDGTDRCLCCPVVSIDRRQYHIAARLHVLLLLHAPFAVSLTAYVRNALSKTPNSVGSCSSSTCNSTMYRACTGHVRCQLAKAAKPWACVVDLTLLEQLGEAYCFR